MGNPETGINRSVLILLLTTTFLAATWGYTFGLISNQSVDNTTDILSSVDLGVYTDSLCTQNLTTINWGTAYPGNNITQTAYIRNHGNTVINLQMETSNYTPAYSLNHLALSWDYTNQDIEPNNVIQVTFTLAVSPNIENIQTYSFDITIISYG